MTPVIPMSGARLIGARLLLEMAREVHKAYYPGQPFGSGIERLFVHCALAIGHLEGKPMSAVKMAHYLEMPRTTVSRRLDMLVARRIARREGSLYYLVEDEAGRRTGHMVRIVRLVTAAASRLPKMDHQLVSEEVSKRVHF